MTQTKGDERPEEITLLHERLSTCVKCTTQVIAVVSKNFNIRNKIPDYSRVLLRTKGCVIRGHYMPLDVAMIAFACLGGNKPNLCHACGFAQPVECAISFV